MRRQRAFASSLKEPLGFEPRLDLKEALIQVSRARLAHGLDIELEFAASLIKTGLRPGLDPVAVGRIESDQLIATAKHHGAHRRLGILKGEVPVPAGRPGQV